MDTALFEKLSQQKPDMQGWFEWLHQNPDLPEHEDATANFVAGLLESWGYDIARNVGGTGIVASLDVGAGTRAIALRSELDALPMQEDGTCRVISGKPGVSHMCGHDGHMTMLLGAARYLAETKNFSGTLRLVFQPAEEQMTGAQKMIADGLFERFPVDAIFGMHNSPKHDVGKIFLKTGPLLTAVDRLKITVTGKGAHGAFPHQGTDPIVAASSIVMALQSIVSRNLSPQDIGVITVGTFHSGTAENIIPPAAELGVSVRSASPKGREVLLRRIEETARMQAESFGATAQVESIQRGAVLVNDASLHDAVAKIATERLGAENVDTQGFFEMASEDFAFYGEAVPSFFAMIGNGDTQINHNPGYTFNENALVAGAAYWVALAEGMLKS